MKINEKMIFITNSKIRLKILTVLFEEDLTMKEINKETSLSYSSISTNIGKLEKEGYVFRENSNYYLSNEIRLYLINLLDFNDSLLLVINNFFDFFLYHNINNLNLHSIEDLYLLKNAKLIENDGYDVYKTYNTIKNIIINGEKEVVKFWWVFEKFLKIKFFENQVINA